MKVGQGVLDKMHAVGDVPFKDSEFLDPPADHPGLVREVGHGLLGDYRSYGSTQEGWRTEGPLPVAG